MSEQAVEGISTRTQISINQKIDEGKYNLYKNTNLHKSKNQRRRIQMHCMVVAANVGVLLNLMS